MGRAASVRRVVGAVIGAGLGGMLLVAALLKAADPPLFVEQVRGYGILPALAGPAAYIVLIVEIAIALLLLFQIAPRWSLLAFGLLMAAFIAATAWTWSQGNTSGCGCFGRLASRQPGEVMAEDAVYLLLAAAAYRLSPWRSRSRLRRAAAAALFLPLAASPWILPVLPVDPWITPLRPGYDIDDLAADDLRVPLGEGRLLVALLGPDCPPCAEALPLLNAAARERMGLRVTGIFSGDRPAARAWVVEHLPAFPMAHAPEKTLRQYYRRLPVVFLAEDGVVERVFWGRAPTPEEVRPSPAPAGAPPSGPAPGGSDDETAGD